MKVKVYFNIVFVLKFIEQFSSDFFIGVSEV